MNKKIAQKILEEFNKENKSKCFQGSYFNIRNFNEDYIFKVVNQVNRFRSISEEYNIKKDMREDRTVYIFYKKNNSEPQEIVEVLDTGNVVKPRSPYDCLNSPYVWYIKLRFYTDKPKKYYPKSSWVNMSNNSKARIYVKDDKKYIRIKDKFRNQIQLPISEANKFIDLSKIKEFKSPKRDIWAFKSDILEQPQILSKKGRELAKKYGVSRKTIYNWKDKLKNL